MPGSSRKGRRPDGYWGHFNLWWRGFHEETGTRPKVVDIESWCESPAYTAAWPNGDGPTVEQAVTHSKGMRPLAEVRRYFVEYRQKKALQRKAGRTRRQGRADPESDDPDYGSQPAEGAQSKDQGDDELGHSGAEDDAGSDSHADQRLEQHTAPSAPEILDPQRRPGADHDGGRGAARGHAKAPVSGLGPSGGTPLSRHAQAQLMLLHEVLYGSMVAAAARPALENAAFAKGVMGDAASDHHEVLRPSGSPVPVNVAREALIGAVLAPLGPEYDPVQSWPLNGSAHCANGDSNASAPASALAMLRPKFPGGEDRGGIRSCNGMQGEPAGEGRRQVLDGGHEKDDDDDDWMPFANCLGPTSPDVATQLLKHTGGPSPGTSLLGILHPAAPRRDSSMARTETGPEPCSVSPSVPAPNLQGLQPLSDAVIVASNTSVQTAALPMLRPKFLGGKECGSMSICGSIQCDQGQNGHLRHLSIGSAGSCIGGGNTGDARGRLASLPSAASAPGARRPAEPQLQHQHSPTALETVTPPNWAGAASAVVAQSKESPGAGAEPERQYDLSPPPSQDRAHLQSERHRAGGSTPHGQSWDGLKGGTLGKRPSEASCDGGIGSGPTPQRRRVRLSSDGRPDVPNGDRLGSFGRVDGGTSGAGHSRHASRAAGKAPGSGSDTHPLARQLYPSGAGQTFTDALGQAYLSMLGNLPLDAYGAYAYDVNRAYVASAAAMYGMHGGGPMDGGLYYPAVLCPSGYPLGVCPLPHCSCKADPLSLLRARSYLAAAACLQPRHHLPQWGSQLGPQQLTQDLGQKDDKALAADAQLLHWLIEKRNAEAMATGERSGRQTHAGLPMAATARAVGTSHAHEGSRPAAHGLATFPIPGLEPPPLQLGRQQAWHGRDPRPAHNAGGAPGGPSPAATLSARGTTGFGALAVAPLSLPLQASAYYAALGIQPFGHLDLQYMAYQERQQAHILSELLGVNTNDISKSILPWATAASAATGANDLGGAYLDRVRLPCGYTGVGNAARQALAEANTDAVTDDQVRATADAGGTASADTDDVESFFSHEPPV